MASAKKGVVLVHGMGTPVKNSFLVTVVNSIADWMANNSKPRTTPELELNINAPSRNPERDQPSAITMRHGEQEWVFREVWWSRLVDAPLYEPMIGWTVVRAAMHFWQLLKLTYEKSWFPALVGVTLVILLPIIAAALSVVFIVLLLAFFVALPFVAVLFTLWPLAGKVGSNFRVALSGIGSVASIAALIMALLPVALRAVKFNFDASAIDGTILLTLVAVISGIVLLSILISIMRRIDDRPTLTSRTIRHELRQLLEPPGGEHGLRDFDDYIRRLARGLEKPRYFTISQWTLFFVRVSAGKVFAVFQPIWRNLLASTYSGLSSQMLNTGERIMAEEIREGSRWGVPLIVLLPFFHFANSLMTLGVYMLGLIAVPTTMLAVWILSRFRGIPGVPRAVRAISNRVDRFLVGSLGDIKVYMDEPVQAARIRKDLLVAIDELSQECTDGIYLVCHSTGAAIAFETLALPANRPSLDKVRSLITVGSIMNMVWRMGARRGSFDEALPPYIRWVNIFTRYDPALAGPLLNTPPVQAHRRLKDKLTEFEVSNEDDLFRDHSSYWSNGHQVVPLIVREIWASKDETRETEIRKNFTYERGQVALRISRRKWQILLLSIPRLFVWYSFPAAILWQVFAMKDFGKGAEIPPLYGLWNFIPYSGFNASFIANPTHDWQSLVAVVIASFAVTVGFYLIYGLARTVLWDGIACELRLFSPNIRS